MPLTGIIDIPNGQGIIPSSSWFITGEDGEIYTVTGNQGISLVVATVGSAVTHDAVWELTKPDFVAAFNALGLVGVPTVGTSAVAQGPIPIPGTACFYHGAYAWDIGTANFWSVALRYRIVSAASVVVDGYLAYKQAPWHVTGLPLGHWWAGWTWGSEVIDGELFAITWLGGADAVSDAAPYLLRLPISGDVQETNTAVWPSRVTSLETQFGNGVQFGFQYLEWFYYNVCAILKHPASATTVMVLTYRQENTLPGSGSNLLTAGSEYILIDYDTQAAGALTSAQALLGQPWADVGLDSVGAAGDPEDDYSAPTVKTTGLAGVKEVLFSRPYSDVRTLQQTRRFSYDEATGLFTPIDVTQWSIEQTIPTTFAEATLALRFSGSTVYGAIYTTGKWVMGEFLLPPIGGLPGRRYVGKLGPVRIAA